MAQRDIRKESKSAWFLLVALSGAIPSINHSAMVTGELKVWHTITLDFDGPQASETDAATFLDYRLNVIFTNGAQSFTVPGFFAADGNAAVTHATSGNKWRARFTPNAPGKWSYAGVMSSGPRIAISKDDGTQVPLAGSTGSFDVAASPVSAQDRDFRGKGRLNHVGANHMQFEGSKQYFLKGGAGSPENFLGYYGFDGTFDAGGLKYPSLGADQLHNFEPHALDWKPGDPLWTDENGDEGKNIIGFVNYISDMGLNSQYFLTMNYQGDGWEIWPWTNFDKRETFDVSKLEQWEMVFSHMQKKGVLMHVLLTETENESLFEFQDGGGAFAHTRKLYYREIIARFGHHLAVVWNLGEENGHSTNGSWGNGTTAQQMKEYASYIKSIDPYGHPVVVHHYPFEQDKVFSPLLGYTDFNGTSLQIDQPYLISKKWDYNEEVARWIRQAKAKSHNWLVHIDEPLGWEYGLITDTDNSGAGVSQDNARKDVLWGTYMAGGAGVDWYFGWKNNSPTSDLGCEDMRQRAAMWKKTRIATDFFHNHVPFHAMTSSNSLLGAAAGYVLAESGKTYLVYLKNGGAGTLDLTGQNGRYEISWFDPRNGGDLQKGSFVSINGGSSQSIGTPPSRPTEDWVVLVRNANLASTKPKAGLLSRKVVDIRIDQYGSLAFRQLESGQSKVSLISPEGRSINIYKGNLNAGDHNFSLPKKTNRGLMLLRIQIGTSEMIKTLVF